ncbi:unnamed protein product [Litomosoides sigmodontis]|uniref:Chromo domain-containing protein n=1 Tax=Litomosoides sigmodontis TaxID=42156 RepID=A0A3P6TEM7_LITSI|nr:unnamed protein product [Litomosoides sigmodontis]
MLDVSSDLVQTCKCLNEFANGDVTSMNISCEKMKIYFDGSFDDEFFLVDNTYDRCHKNRRKRMKEYLLRWKGYSSTDDNYRSLELGFNHNMIMSNCVIKKKNNRKKNFTVYGKVGTARSGCGNRPRYMAQSRCNRRGRFRNANKSIRNRRNNSPKQQQSNNASGSSYGNQSASSTAPPNDNRNGHHFTDANKEAVYVEEKISMKDQQWKSEVSGSDYSTKTTHSRNDRKSTDANKCICDETNNLKNCHQSRFNASASDSRLSKSTNIIPSGDNGNDSFTDAKIEFAHGRTKGTKNSTIVKEETKENECEDNNANACTKKISRKRISKSLPPIVMSTDLHAH